MYEFIIYDKRTGEEDFLWDYSWNRAVERAGIADDIRNGYIVLLHMDYID